jgi:hypothetical protein
MRHPRLDEHGVFGLGGASSLDPTSHYDANMTRHLVTSAIFVSLALVPVIFVCKKWDVGPGVIRKYSIIGGIVLLLVAGVSAASHTAVVRCRRDPREFCEYNDSVPMMATMVFVFVATCGYKSWRLYDTR